ncbi:MAG: DUF4416 family protein [Planctomycetes bacterium]|nr:DUF4416 family protein [Planctomycetota bacterium]
MAAPHAPVMVTPLVALLYGSEAQYAAAREALEGRFGAVELESPAFPFTSTDYYAAQMGESITRRFLTFARLADASELAAWKLFSNELEGKLAARFAGGPPRPVNVDPGYVTGAKLVLASTKDFAHRIYLRDGIFAEITLRFRDGAWQAHEFTFPDFRAETYHSFLKQARDKHLAK